MHKFYGFLIASAFAVGLALPHGARAAGGPLGQYDPSGTKGGGKCLDPKMPCEASPGSGVASSGVDPLPREFGMCATCASKKGYRGKVCAASDHGVPSWACTTVDLAPLWGSSEPFLSCVRMQGEKDATCDGAGSF